MKEEKKNLSIRSKFALVVITSTVFLAGTLYAISMKLLPGSYAEIERAQALENLSRARDSINDIVSQLAVKISDWAVWDDTYQFAADKNEAYVKSNLGNTSIALLKINAMVFTDVGGKVIFAKAINLPDATDADVSEIAGYVDSHKEMTAHLDITSSISGMIPLSRGAFIFISQPILTSEGAGPSRGSIIFGRYLDAEVVASVAKLAHLSLSVFPYGVASSSLDVAQAEKSITEPKSSFVSPLSADLIAAYGVLYDFYKQPLLTLKVEIPRDAYNQGRVAFYIFMGIVVVLVLIVGTIVTIIIDRVGLARFTRLSERVHEIGEKQDLSMRVEVGSHDEIGRLATAINGMLDDIVVSQKAEKSLSEEVQGTSEELKIRLDEMEKMNKLMVDRELRMSELKKENERLRKGQN